LASAIQGHDGLAAEHPRIGFRRHSTGHVQFGHHYYAVRGEAGWDKPYDLRAVVTLAPNVGLFITKQDSGIQTIADLKDKRVVVGPAGAGFEMFWGR
jgi:TRAP-type uncharacterized transport system substrate-binding protein